MATTERKQHQEIILPDDLDAAQELLYQLNLECDDIRAQLSETRAAQDVVGLPDDSDEALDYIAWRRRAKGALHHKMHAYQRLRAHVAALRQREQERRQAEAHARAAQNPRVSVHRARLEAGERIAARLQENDDLLTALAGVLGALCKRGALLTDDEGAIFDLVDSYLIARGRPRK